MNRRTFIKAGGLAALWPQAFAQAGPQGVWVNDIHGQLYPTRVRRIESVGSLEAVARVLRQAERENRAVSIAGGRHAMGAQAFATAAILLDTLPLNRVLDFDRVHGMVEAEAGIQWPELIGYLHAAQKDEASQWTIAQKQTGADRLSLGGSLAANMHGRGLGMKPFVSDVQAFTLMNAKGDFLRCSRSENPELFRLVAGGYGLFGVVYSITLKLVRREKLERVVEVIEIGDVLPGINRRIADGYSYGDFQFSINEKSKSFLRRGVFSCYRSVDPATPMPAAQKELSDSGWRDLLYLAHADEEQAFERYSRYYLSTSGQIYWSDTHQLSFYPDGYHRELDQKTGSRERGTEVITEIYVPRDELDSFMKEAGAQLRNARAEVIYGTVRFIEQDNESFLAWAKKPYACIIFNLHVVHSGEGMRRAGEAFRMLIDLGRKRGGSYYLTYHRFGTREQVLSCYPQFPEFLRLKRKYDPQNRFQSDWYRHYKKMFADRV
jgi:FAD/FMN-containing dehydrogenase